MSVPTITCEECKAKISVDDANIEAYYAEGGREIIVDFQCEKCNERRIIGFVPLDD